MSVNLHRGLGMVATTAAVLVVLAPAAQAEESPSPSELLDHCGTADLCVFHPSGREVFPGGRRQVGNLALNCSDVTQNEMVAWSDTTGESNSLGVTVGAEMQFAEVYAASISATYQHTWTWWHTETRTDNLSVQPWHVGEVFHAPQLQRVWGTYELHFASPFYGHYIWYVPFEATGPTEDGSASVTFFNREMTATERAQCPATRDVGAPVVRAGRRTG
jgi:hypothetical protein